VLGAGGLPLLAAGAFGPAAAAALVPRWTGGSLRAWLRPLWHWRVPLRFWLYALGLPALLFVVVNAELAVLGEPVDLGRLQARHSPVMGTVVLGVVWGGWHLPIYGAAAVGPLTFVFYYSSTTAAAWTWRSWRPLSAEPGCWCC